MTTANRQQRRAGMKMAAVPRGAGTFRQPVDPPEVVGEITATEAYEIRVRNQIAGRLNDRTQKLSEELNDALALQRIAAQEKVQYIRGLVTERGFSLDDEYAVDDDSGQIRLVARAVTMEPVAELHEEE